MIEIMSSAKYHADPAPEPSLSSSIAKILLRESPYKARHSHPRLNPSYREDHDSKFDLGTCAHAVLLENDSSRIVIVKADDWRTKAAKEARNAAWSNDKTPLLERHHDAVMVMVGAARAFLEDCEITEYWNEGESEVSVIWQEDDIYLRCRPDRLATNRRCIVDYKSTTDAAPDAFGRQIVRMGYHWQDAFYRRGLRAETGRDPAFVFLAQSVEPPHECSLVGCDAALREIADAEVERAVQIWHECITTDQWPTYDNRIHWTLPAMWQIKEHEQRIMEEA